MLYNKNFVLYNKNFVLFQRWIISVSKMNYLACGWNALIVNLPLKQFYRRKTLVSENVKSFHWESGRQLKTLKNNENGQSFVVVE